MPPLQYKQCCREPSALNAHILAYRANVLIHSEPLGGAGLGEPSRKVRIVLQWTGTSQYRGGTSFAQLLAVLPESDAAFMECCHAILLCREGSSYGVRRVAQASDEVRAVPGKAILVRGTCLVVWLVFGTDEILQSLCHTQLQFATVELCTTTVSVMSADWGWRHKRVKLLTTATVF